MPQTMEELEPQKNAVNSLGNAFVKTLDMLNVRAEFMRVSREHAVSLKNKSRSLEMRVF